MNWEDRIVSTEDIMAGKPCIKGTRLTIDFLLERLASGWSEKQLYESYPNLTPEDLRAIFAYASESLRDHLFLPVPTASK
ncbi:MAG: DUF433 domain-containing protein [Chloracidobacterium sp.]|nr:DUF433 domain-containing protein [Chloracidobacterium sp.]